MLYALLLISLTGSSWGQVGADPAAAVRADARAFSAAAKALREGRYGPEDHKAASEALGAVAGHLAAWKIEPVLEQAIESRVKAAAAIEGAVWGQAAEEGGLGKANADRLAAGLEGIAADLRGLLERERGPKGSEARRVADRAGVDVRAGMDRVARLSGSGAASEAASATFWDGNDRRGDVADPNEEGAGRARAGAAEPAAAAGLKTAKPPAPAEASRPASGKDAFVSGIGDALKRQFGTVEGILSSLAGLVVGLLLAALSGIGLLAKLAVALVSVTFLITTVGPLIREAVSAFRQWRAAKEGSAESRTALYRLGLTSGSVVAMAVLVAAGYGLGKSPPGKAAVAGMQRALSSAAAKAGLGPAAAAAPAAKPTLGEVLRNPDLVKGWSPAEVQKLIPPDWTHKPLAKGIGMRFFNPAKPGEVLMIERGWPNATDPVHAGPYMRLSAGGKVVRVPLEGNPKLP